MGKERKAKTLLRFFRDFGKERCEKLKFVCSDMWKPYIKVIKKKAPDALHILDRFHIVQKLGQAIDKIRAAEVKRLAAEGYDEEVLKHTKYCFLKKEENLTEKTENEIDRCSSVRPEERSGLSAEGKLSTLLELQEPVLGRVVSEQMVCPRHAITLGTDQGLRANATTSSAADHELVQGAKAVFFGHC